MTSIRVGMTEGVVEAGAVEIPYRAAGRGRPVILLTPVSPDFDVVRERLSRAHRVIQPVRFPDGAAWEDGIRALVEGLGLDAPDLVVQPGLEARARALAAEGRVRLGRVRPVRSIDV